MIHSKRRDHLNHSVAFLIALIMNELKISPKKYQLLRQKMTYMGQTLLTKEMLYNILLLINHYISNNPTKCHSRSMSDNRDLTDISSENFFTSLGYCISFLDISSPHEYTHSGTKYSILPLPV